MQALPLLQVLGSRPFGSLRKVTVPFSNLAPRRVPNSAVPQPMTFSPSAVMALPRVLRVFGEPRSIVVLVALSHLKARAIEQPCQVRPAAKSPSPPMS